MGKDKEETGFVGGSHLPSVDKGEFRCWSKATKPGEAEAYDPSLHFV